MTHILIGGKKRPFKFGINAARVFCKETGKSINDLNDIAETDLDAIVSILYAGLFHGAKAAGKEVDFDSWQVGEWMDDMDQKEITKAFESMQDQTQTATKKK